MWIRPFQAYRDQTYNEALNNYIKYCTKEGPPVHVKNIDSDLYSPISVITNSQLQSQDAVTPDEVALTPETEEITVTPKPKKSKTQ